MNNAITLVGNLTRDPELRLTPKGTTVAHLGLAVNRRRRDAEGNEVSDTSFFNIVAWGSLGENCVDSLHRGDLVVVHGRLEQRAWETATGDRRSAVEVIAEEVGPSLRWVTAALQRRPREAVAVAA